MEDRSVASLECIQEYQQIDHRLILRIDDNPSVASLRIGEKTDAIQNIMIDGLGVGVGEIHRTHINSPFGQFDSRLNEFLVESQGSNLIVDITTLPKKYFFFLIKKLMSWEDGFRNIVVTYAEPRTYCDGTLAGNPEPWDALPGFRAKRGTPTPQKMVVGIGYEPLGLPGLVESGEFHEGTVTFLFPFPAQPDRNSKNWRFIRQIFPNSEQRKLKIKRVDAMNVPEIFDLISGLGENGATILSLAPFGPKPVSLAMALYAAKTSHLDHNTSVHYTQPTYYNPDYSSGIKMHSGVPVINTYCIKMNGQNLY